MFAAIALLRRNPGATPEEFLNWWHGEHVEHALAIPGALEYVTYPITEQRASMTGDNFSTTPDLDGLGIIHYASREAYRQAMATKAFQTDKRHLGASITPEVYYGVPHVHRKL